MSLSKPEFRQGTWDSEIFRCVVEHNEYNIPSNLKNFKVIDIGGHIGSFSWLAARNGAKEVFYCEPLRENFDIGMKWINKNFVSQKNFSTVFATFPMAIWKDCEKPLIIGKSSDVVNTGGASCLGTQEEGENRLIVPTFPFDEIIRLRLLKRAQSEKVLLKLDCEGAEFPILFSSTELDSIDYICGEFHEPSFVPDEAKVEGFENYDALTLQKFLKESGFAYTYFERSKDSNGNLVPLGHFWAAKTNESFFLNLNLSSDFQIEI